MRDQLTIWVQQMFEVPWKQTQSNAVCLLGSCGLTIERKIPENWKKRASNIHLLVPLYIESMEPVTILWQSPDTQAPSSASVAPYQPKYSKQVQTLAFCFRHLVSSIYVAAILIVLRRFCATKQYYCVGEARHFHMTGLSYPGLAPTWIKERAE